MAVKSKPRRLDLLLKQSKPLKQLLLDCQQHTELLQLVKSRLPDPLCEHCCFARINQRELALAVDSPAWSSRLRFMQRGLLQELTSLGIEVTSLKVSVQPTRQPAKTPARPGQRPLSDDNARLIQRLAEHISDAHLKNSLQRLTRHQIKS
jgi:hypothetical protein